MKNVVFQFHVPFNGNGLKNKEGAYYTGAGLNAWANRSSQYFQEYARRHNADYVLLQDKYVNSTSVYFEVLRLYKDPQFDKYDNLLYVDMDVMPADMDTNVFELDYVDVAGWPEHPDMAFSVKIPWPNERKQIAERFADFGAPVVESEIANSYRVINSGVMMWSKSARLRAREQFDDHERWYHHKNCLLDKRWRSAGQRTHCLDQPYFNAMFNKYNYNVLELDKTWNMFPTKDPNAKCKFAHYIGAHKDKILKRFPPL